MSIRKLKAFSKQMDACRWPFFQAVPYRPCICVQLLPRTTGSHTDCPSGSELLKSQAWSIRGQLNPLMYICIHICV